jgi:hypothetical protein
MLSYEDFPPLKKLELVLVHYPDAALLYVKLWSNRDFLNHVNARIAEIRSIYNISPTLFRNHCLELAELSLLRISTDDEFYLIDLYP